MSENVPENDDRAVSALHAEIDAAVVETAPVAWRAGSGCFRDPKTGQTCAPYHRSWQYLLLLGVRNSTYPDTPFLLGTFRRLARAGDRRVLISGSADYAMLAHVLRAFKLEGSTPRITVIDQCDTPLLLNRWYAERAGIDIETVQSDAISFRGKASFDVVCTHSFIGWFSPEDREKLVANWARNLRDGGHVVTTRRLREATEGGGQHAYDADELKRFEGKVRDAALAYGESLGMDPEEIVRVAVDDARARVRYTMTSADELTSLFERHGLEVVIADADETTAPGDHHMPSGPIRGAGKRVRIVARLGVSS